MKKIQLVIISTLLSLSLFAQKSDTTGINRKHEFGAHAGFTTGVGLSYRYWPSKFGVQFTLLPIKSDELTFVSVGATGLYSFYNSEYVRFFGYWGNNFTFNKEKYYSYSSSSQSSMSNSYYEQKSTYNMGFGPGFGFGSRVRFNIMVGYGLYDILGEFLVYPTAEVGLYFRL